MIRRLFFSRQLSIVTVLTIIFIIPSLWTTGTNIVTHTYSFGCSQFWKGFSPYVDPKGAGDFFKYSPLFAWLYTPFAAMKSSPQAIAWGICNIFFFWLGVCLWFPWKQIKSKWLWLGFIFCSMEADGSFRYQQMNAALVGLSLTGLYLYKEKKYFEAGALLAILTNIKILPGIFLATLLVPPQKKYFQGICVGLIICLSIPLWFWGWEHTLTYHYDWYSLLKRDTQTNGLLDIATTLKRIGFSEAKTFVLYPIAFLSIGILFSKRLSRSSFSWDLWISLGLFTLLLVNPRTESPTFILGAPAYLFLLRYILSLPGLLKSISLFVWGTGIFLVTLCMNDIWPKVLWNPNSWLQANKTYGVLILWLMTFFLNLKKDIGIKLPLSSPVKPL
ncbi:MAG: DUF2029 domain-containing protein [Deltaproteobacteria bacterium]|nr:DUF2029 domain-containing protein [Deltaproteobacteria bacterium]